MRVPTTAPAAWLPVLSRDGLSLAGGWARFSALRRWGDGAITDDLTLLARFSAPRPALCGLPTDRPLIMGILNVTPDSFSDGGQHATVAQAVAAGLKLVADGADILDIGGESTRPGALPVAPEVEAERVLPVIAGLRAAGCAAVLSVDTRHAAVAEAALASGARIFNDVSALTHDPDSLRVAAAYAAAGGAVCLMHAQGEPSSMQDNPHYEDVVAEVHAWLTQRLQVARAAGIPDAALITDPGLGFGKTGAHNIQLMRALPLFHGLGPVVMLGLSRKRFIGTLTHEPVAAARVMGSVAGTLAGVAAGVQIHRVHDVRAVWQAIQMWQAVTAPVW